MAMEVITSGSKASKDDIDTFPVDGLVTARESARHLSIGLSTYWLFVKQKRLPRAVKLGARISRWRAVDIRRIALEGIPSSEGGDNV